MKKHEKPDWWDWTQRGGTSNSSIEYNRLVRLVEARLRNLHVGCDTHMEARALVSELAHGQYLVPARGED